VTWELGDNSTAFHGAADTFGFALGATQFIEQVGAVGGTWHKNFLSAGGSAGLTFALPRFLGGASWMS